MLILYVQNLLCTMLCVQFIMCKLLQFLVGYAICGALYVVVFLFCKCSLGKLFVSIFCTFIYLEIWSICKLIVSFVWNPWALLCKLSKFVILCILWLYVVVVVVVLMVLVLVMMVMVTMHYDASIDVHLYMWIQCIV